MSARILLIAPEPFYQERGTPIAIRMLAEVLCADGNAVDLVTYHEGTDVDVRGLRILRAPAPPGVHNIPIGISWKKLVCDIALCWRVFTLAVSQRYDVIHAVEEAVFPAVVLRAFTRARVVYDMDSMLGDQLLAKWRSLRPVARVLAAVERAAIRRADAVFTVCDDLALTVRQTAPKVAVFVIEDVALSAQPCADNAPGLLRNMFDIRGALALYVGNLASYQGIELLLRAMTLIDADCDVTLVLIGGSAADIKRAQVLVDELDLQQRVLLAAARPLAHLAHYLAQADVLVSPRLRGNNTPMKVYSYMQSGVPILATRSRAHTQVLDEQCAYLADLTPQALAEGLMAMVRNPELRGRLGAAARRRALEHYSIDAFRDKVRAAYQAVLAPKPAEEGAPANPDQGDSRYRG